MRRIERLSDLIDDIPEPGQHRMGANEIVVLMTVLAEDWHSGGSEAMFVNKRNIKDGPGPVAALLMIAGYPHDFHALAETPQTVEGVAMLTRPTLPVPMVHNVAVED